MIINFVQLDTGSILIVDCLDNGTGQNIDLTGAIVKFLYTINGGSLQTKTMTITSPATSGRAQYTFLTGELTTGTMTAEIQITDVYGSIITSLDKFNFSIRARLS